MPPEARLDVPCKCRPGSSSAAWRSLQATDELHVRLWVHKPWLSNQGGHVRGVQRVRAD